MRFWQRLGLPGLIDVHTHFMPERVLSKVWAYFDSAGPLTGLEWPITYRHEEDERLALLRSFGVRRFTSMLYPHKAGMADWLNGWAADFARARARTACTPRRSSRRRARRPMCARPSRRGRASSSRISRWGVTTPTTRCWSPCGGCSPRPGSRW